MSKQEQLLNNSDKLILLGVKRHRTAADEDFIQLIKDVGLPKIKKIEQDLYNDLGINTGTTEKCLEIFKTPVCFVKKNKKDKS